MGGTAVVKVLKNQKIPIPRRKADDGATLTTTSFERWALGAWYDVEP